MQTFYDPSKTFEENVANGPFRLDDIDLRETEPELKYTFLGHFINFPFGIAAGSLPTSRHTSAAFRLGYDVVVYKTQRSSTFPCNPFPNILPVQIDGDLTPEKMQESLTVASEYPEDLSKLSITNSFGVPSSDASVWTADIPAAVTGAGKGQLLIMSVVGTIKEGFSPEDYYDDFALSARLAKTAGAKVVEINLSCPNVATEGVVCYSKEAVYEICKRVKAAIGDTPLVIKVGYYSVGQQVLLEEIIELISPYIGAVSVINTLAAAIVDANGEQALPGKNRLRSGICGGSIKWAGLDMVRRLAALRKNNGYKYEIIGVGGVVSPVDFIEYRSAGADVVQAVTAPIWNPHLAAEIKAVASNPRVK